MASCSCNGEGFHGMVGHSAVMRRVYSQIERFSRSPIPVLITGESGTGKEMAARAIWAHSGSEGPFVVVNSAAIPPTLIESELFGHEAGAFTGAVRQHTGLLAQAQNGILFLDEIAELPLEAQAKLLRAIDSGEYRRLGGVQVLLSRFRLIAATHRDLGRCVEEGSFREDLLYRLGAARILIPPLRHRLQDLPKLSDHFLRRYRDASGADRPTSLSQRGLELLMEAGWTGNLRQLKNVIEAAAAVTDGAAIGPEEVREFLTVNGSTTCGTPSLGTGPLCLAEAIARAERQAIMEALRATDGDRSAAAAILGISRSTLYRKLTGIIGSTPTVSQI